MSRKPKYSDLSERVYGFLLRLLPKGYLDAYERDAVELFRDLRREAKRSGRFGTVVSLWLRLFVQLVACSVRLRFGTTESAPVSRSLGSGRSGSAHTLMANVIQDLQVASRSFSKRLGFSLTVVFIVALGVGATTTVFSVVDGVLLRKLPYPHADRLYFFDHGSHSIPDFLDFRDRTTSFAAMVGGWDRDVHLTGSGEPERLTGALVTDGFFELLGAQPYVGRLFVHDDFVGEPRVVVISHGLWVRRFGSDPDLVGSPIMLDGEPLVVAGVMNPHFMPPRVAVGASVDVWFPMDLATSEFGGRDWHILGIIALLKEDRTRATAQAELDVLAEALAADYPEDHHRHDGSVMPVEILPLHDATVGEIGPNLLMLMGAVGLMLLIACANLANLFFARGTDRKRELAVRAALGAGRARIVGQLLTETTFLSVVGGTLAICLAFAGVHAFKLFNPGDIPRAATVAVDLRVFAFALVTSFATGLLFGIPPALTAARIDVNEALKEGVERRADRGRIGMRGMLVAAEIAMALVLLIGAGLLFNSFIRLQHVDPGFRTANLTTMELDLGFDYSESDAVSRARTEFTAQLLERVRGLPNVEDVSAGVLLPFTVNGGSRCCWRTSIQPVPVRDEEDRILTLVHPVAPGYFRVLGAPLLRGREFVSGDERAARIPAIVNEPLARRLFDATDVVGRSFTLRDSELVVVGIADSIRQWGNAEPVDFQVYVPYAAFGGQFSRLNVAIKTAGSDPLSATLLRDAVWSLEPDLPIGTIATMRQVVSRSVAEPRFYTLLLTGFASVAVLLAAGGIYGSMLYVVGRRRREVGIRLAVGARSGDVVKLILRYGVLLTVVGMAVGVGAAIVASHVLESMVFGIATTDPLTFTVVSILLGAVAIVACWVPARNASRTDPVTTLRAE